MVDPVTLYATMALLSPLLMLAGQTHELITSTWGNKRKRSGAPDADQTSTDKTRPVSWRSDLNDTDARARLLAAITQSYSVGVREAGRMFAVPHSLIVENRRWRRKRVGTVLRGAKLPLDSSLRSNYLIGDPKPLLVSTPYRLVGYMSLTGIGCL
jgi:hypothetical protein